MMKMMDDIFINLVVKVTNIEKNTILVDLTGVSGSSISNYNISIPITLHIYSTTDSRSTL